MLAARNENEKAGNRRGGRRGQSSSPSPSMPLSIISSKSLGSSSPVSSAMLLPISLAQRAIALGSSISPSLLGSARASSDDSLERTRATREMSLRSFFPPQRSQRGSSLSATTPTRHEKGFLHFRHRYS